MPVYNSQKYIRESIESIICQSFVDFECIVIDDGSTDDTVDIITSYKDKRITIFKNKHNFINSLNLGLRKSKGIYIARMDADDIMHPDRLRTQYNIMEMNSNVAVCSTWMTQFGVNIPENSVIHSFDGFVKKPLLAFLQGNYIFHPTVMMRKSFLDEHHLVYQNYPYAEDYKLWTEIAKNKGVFYVESQPLLRYRISDSQVSYQKRKMQIKTSEKILYEIIQYLQNDNNCFSSEIKKFFGN